MNEKQVHEMNNTSKYSYKLRPGYGSKELLLDFNTNESPDQLQQELHALIEKAGFVLTDANDLWINDELLFNYTSKNGVITFSRDVWDMFFIMGKDNQTDILLLDKLLCENPLFEKTEVDFSAYE